MTDWDLHFRESRPFTHAACETALSNAIRGPVTIEIGLLVIDGDPREGGKRPVTITLEVDRFLQIVMKVDEYMRCIGDEATFARITGVTLKDAGASCSNKLDVWRRLRDELAKLGCTDVTLESNPAPIVDDLEAVGDRSTAAQMRKDIAAALIERARSSSWPHVILRSPRVDDLEAVLAAYPDPKRIESVSLDDWQRPTLPAGLARFSSSTELAITERGLDASALRGLSLPKLKTLFLTSSGVTRVSKQDLAGFPKLAQLYLQDNPLEDLELDIIDACPRLRRVLVVRTPLAKNAPRMAALNAHWKDVVWTTGEVDLEDDDPPGEGQGVEEPKREVVPPHIEVTPHAEAIKAPPHPAVTPRAEAIEASPHIAITPHAETIAAPSRIEPSPEVPADELRPYFDAILAAPDDDAPRLELARVLTEHGDRRGEHIRLSCELDKLDREDPVRAKLEARCKQLPSLWWFARPPELNFPVSLGHRRGLIDEIECAIGYFIAYADALMKQAPIRVYDVNPAPEGQGPALASCPALAKLRRLRLHYVKDDDATAILASPYLANLRELEVSRPLDGEAAVARLAAAIRGLKHLRTLSMYYCTIDGSACDALAQLVDDMQLELLDVRSVNTPETGIAVLRARLGEERVMPRPEPRIKYRFGVLDLAQGKLSVDEVRALLESGEYRDAIELNLGGKRIGDAGIARLARSGAFPNLTSLSLAATGITDAGAYALANDSVGLEQLEELWLGDVPAEGDSIGARDQSGVSDGAVEALARSARLPALRTIGRSKEYRRTFDGGAREGREVVPIQRDDGRVVESTIDHSIWP